MQEDFDIQNNGTVDSRHQVKAYKDAKYPKWYKKMFIDSKLLYG